MLEINPFAVAAQVVSAGFLQWYLCVMAAAVALGVLFDIAHKGSARYFFENFTKSRTKGTPVSGGELVSIAAKTALVDVMASGEFCNPRRRIAHLLAMYGFVTYVATTAAMVFCYPTAATPTPGIVPLLWWIGGLMVLVGGLWFWFFIRADVSAEGNSPFRIMRADLFVLSLMVSVALGLVWAWRGAGAGVLLWLYLTATAVLFGSVYWSKFAHMFFKPAAAFEKRVSKANGTAQNLPTQSRDDPEQQKRHSMELLQNAPMDMGLGIKREAPRHY